jgi:hypothetical protein
VPAKDVTTMAERCNYLGAIKARTSVTSATRKLLMPCSCGGESLSFFAEHHELDMELL